MLMSAVTGHVDDGAMGENLTGVASHGPTIHVTAQLYVGDYALNLELCSIEDGKSCLTCLYMTNREATVFESFLKVEGNQRLIFC